MMEKARILVVCTTDSMIWNFLVPHIKNLEKRGYIVECACSITDSFFEDLKDQYGFCMHQINFERNPYSMRNINAFLQLKKIIRERAINLIFCHEPVGGAIGRIAGRMTNCKVIYMAHGFHFYKGAQKSAKIYYYIEKYLSQYTDVLLTINQEDYKVSQSFKAKENYILPGIGVDTEKFIYKPDYKYLRCELGIGENDVIMLSVGELIERKNHETIINVVARIKDPHIHYVVVGDGELRYYLNEKVSILGLNNVHLLGYRTDINKLCNSADIFIMPSYQEGLSVALMEAMACGMPIIASRIRGNVDLIDENKGGYLVNVTDEKGYIKAIKNLIHDSDKRERMGRYNMKKVEDYDIKNVSKQLNPIVERIGGGHFFAERQDGETEGDKENEW